MSYSLSTIQDVADADNLFSKAASALQPNTVVNTLTSATANFPLSAAQGKILSDTMSNKFFSVDSILAHLVIFDLFTDASVLGGYWSSDERYLFVESTAPITPVVVGSAVGSWVSLIGPVAVQATTANKPIFRITPESAVPWLDAMTSTAKMTATFDSALGSSCTVIRVGPIGVEIQENVTIGATYDIALPMRFNTDVLVINRALTDGEKLQVLSYMQRRQPALGSEQVTNPNFDANLDGWSVSPGNGSISWVAGGSVRYTYNGTEVAGQVPSLNSPPLSVLNEPTHLVIDVTQATGSMFAVFGAGKFARFSGTGIKRFVGSSTLAGNIIQLYRADAGQVSDFTINSVSAKRVL